MNIGIVVDNEFNNDIRVRKEVRILKDNGYKVFVLCYSYNDKEYDKIDGIKIERIKLKKKFKDIIFATQNRFPYYLHLWKTNIKNFIINNQIDIIHTHDLYMAKPSYLGIKSSKKNVKLVLDLHENFPAAIDSYNWTKGTFRNFLVNPKLWSKKESEYLKYADKIIVLSENFKNLLLVKYPFLENKNITVYPNVIDFKRFDKFKVNNNIEKYKLPTLLYFGVVAERRGVFDSIDALKEIINKGFNIILLIIGPVDKVDEERFLKEINHKKIKEFVVYIPWIHISELISYLNVTDICLAPFIKNPQHESGIANKLFQYMYGGKPIIASDCAPQQELIESNNCGLIYKTQKEFVDKIIFLIENEELRIEMGAQAKKTLHEKFNPEEIDGKLLKVYSSFFKPSKINL